MIHLGSSSAVGLLDHHPPEEDVDRRGRSRRMQTNSQTGYCNSDRSEPEIPDHIMTADHHYNMCSLLCLFSQSDWNISQCIWLTMKVSSSNLGQSHESSANRSSRCLSPLIASYSGISQSNWQVTSPSWHVTSASGFSRMMHGTLASPGDSYCHQT